MIRRFALLALALVVLGGCWPFGHGKKSAAPPPVLANSPRTIDSLWQVGVGEFNNGHWGDARKAFDRVGTGLAATDPRYSRLRFFQAEIALAEGTELDAVRIFRRIADETPQDSLAPDALLRAGDAYAALWRNPELDPTYGQTALGVYQEVIARYPSSEAAKRAQLGVSELNEQFAFKEYRSALFYYKFKAYESAILMLRSVVADYPRAEIVPDALGKLVEAYQKLGYEEDLKEACGYIARFHPEPGGPIRLCPATQAADSTAPGAH